MVPAPSTKARRKEQHTQLTQYGIDVLHLFPTKLCGVLVFRSVPRVDLLLLLLPHFHTSTQLCHIQLCHTQLCHIQTVTHTHLSHTPSFRVAGVALGDIYLHFAWQTWHLVTSTFVLRGRHCPLRHPPSFCVAGVALGDIYLRFAWQASYF